MRGSRTEQAKSACFVVGVDKLMVVDKRRLLQQTRVTHRFIE